MTQSETPDAAGMTVAQYLTANGIAVTPVDRDHAAGVGVKADIPTGWQAAPDGQFPGATEVLVEPGLVENGFAPNAVLLVGTLSSRVDPHALLDCSFTDARALPGWDEGEVRDDEVAGWPSRFVRGTFSAEQLDLAVTTRYVVLGDEQQYLIQLTVTVLADQLDKLAFDIAVINDGLVSAIG